jgi:hypothetical protein
MDKVEVEVLGPAPDKRYLARFTDTYTGDENSIISRGHTFTLEGYLIKVAGTGNGEGVWFVSPTTAARVQVTELNENGTRIIRGLIPATLSQGQWNLEVVTRYSGGGADNLLKEPRTIALSHRLVCLSRQSETEEAPENSPSDA